VLGHRDDHYGPSLGASDPFDQKDQGIHSCRKRGDAFRQLIDAIFEPGDSGLNCPEPFVQSSFQRDHPAVHTGNIVLQAV